MHIGKEPVVPVGHDLNMLGRDIVGNIEHLLVTVADNDLAIIAPAARSRLGGWQDC